MLALKQRVRSAAGHRTLMMCVVLLSFWLNAFVAQTHVHATQQVAAAAHGHASGPSLEYDTNDDVCVLCQIASHATPLLFHSIAQLLAELQWTGVEAGDCYESPPLILAHSGQARAPPANSI